MIHTMELQRQIPNEVFYLLNDQRPQEERWDDRIVFYNNENAFNTSDVRKSIKKITVQKISSKQEKVSYTWLFLQLNVPRLLGYVEPRNPIKVRSDDLSKVNRRLRRVTDYIYNEFKEKTQIDFKEWGKDFSIRRIDYAIDIVTEKNAHANELIRLLKKGYQAPFLKLTPNQKNYYAVNSAKRKKERRAINCYNKTAYELEKGNKQVASNLLRFEVQLGYSQIKKFANQHKLTQYQTYEMEHTVNLLFELSPYVLKKYYNKIAEPFPYYRKETILQKITNMEVSPQQQQQIKAYLKEIAKRNRTVHQLKRRHKAAINCLKALEINPVPLSSQIRDVPFLNSIYHHIETAFQPKVSQDDIIQRMEILQARKRNALKKNAAPQ